MRMPILSIVALGLFATLGLSGCPWSNSPDVFEGAKGISMPSFGGPPHQTEPPLEDDVFPQDSENE